ncbi:MAG TPA: O-antigen ligase family protein [Verrucomicrobiae bacterium]|nr:O-antigen ligase family protein [Verrucomicrobiae bacterium]
MKGFKNWFVFGLAAVAFLAPLKFGTPAMLQSQVPAPANPLEWLFYLWPNELAVILVFVGFVWLVLDRERMLARVDFLFVLPLIFLLTQMLAAPTSICRQTTIDTLMLFTTCVLLFYVGAWYVRDGAATARIFGGLALATMLVCVLALEQHFGGLEESRKEALLYLDASKMPKDFLLRMTSNRVFASFVYPNALAGFLVIAFAPTLVWVWVRARGWDARVRWITLLFVAGVMVFCLVLTGSRGGFVAFAAMAVTALWCSVPRLGRRAAITMGGSIFLLAVIFVFAERRGFIHLGAQSLEARTDYWRGAMAISKDHPWVGTGPGTFGSIYPKYKTAQTEEAQAVHNNYLQMWSDSGVLAFISFTLLWIVGVRDAFRLARRRKGDAAAIAICGVLVGWSMHGLVDFDLYVPGVALPVFILLGSVQGLKEIPRTDTVTPRRRTNWLVGLVCAAMLFAVLWLEGRGLAASLAFTREQELRRIHPLAALQEARSAVRLSPWNLRYQSGLGELALLTGNPDEGIAAYRQAVADDPYRSSCWWHLAEARKAVYGVDAQTVEILRKAVALNPTEATYSNALVTAEKSVRQPPRTLLESPPTKGSGSTP